MLKNKKYLLIAVMACIVYSLSAQTYSPYSRYGYGILKDKAVGPSKAMGGIGYGLRTGLNANPLNPASYSEVDSLTFIFDIGVSAVKSTLSDGVNRQSENNGGLDYITMLMPLSKRLGLSLGVVPFSSVGYSFGSTETIGGISYVKTFSGSGGLSQAYAGLGYLTPVKGLSVGANASFLFGVIRHTRSLPAFSSSDIYTSVEYSELRVNRFKFDFGSQYEMSLSDKNKLILGAVFEPNVNSKANYVRRHYELTATESIGDTLTINGVDAGMPTTYGLGFTLIRDRKLTLGADVTYQKWSDVKFSSEMGDGLTYASRFNDRWRYNFGAEYMINPYDRNFLHKIRFRGGFNYSNSYINVVNSDGKIKGYDEYGATVGFGIPLRDKEAGDGKVSYLNIGFEYKKIKSGTSNMINEEYFGVSVNVNINELWFFKRKAL